MHPPRIPLTTHHILSTIALPSRHRALHTTTSLHRKQLYIRSYESNAVPTIPKCPPPLCACNAMPSGLDIDHEKRIDGTMPPYAQHVVVRTGMDDWASRIEEEEEEEEEEAGTGVNFARGLKELVGKGGRFFDPKRPVLITNSSLAPIAGPDYTSVHIFPQNLLVPKIRNTLDDREAFVAQFIGPKSAFPRMIRTKAAARSSEARANIKITQFIDPQKRRLQYVVNTTPTIFICGHHSRDTRCGTLGPILRSEFISCTRMIGRRPGYDRSTFEGSEAMRLACQSRVALTSHVGGHAFAGNAIIYIPRDFTLPDGKNSPLAGKGIWYGRVEPRHVWGIVEETFKRGTVIEELLRGIHNIDHLRR